MIVICESNIMQGDNLINDTYLKIFEKYGMGRLEEINSPKSIYIMICN